MTEQLQKGAGPANCSAFCFALKVGSVAQGVCLVCVTRQGAKGH